MTTLSQETIQQPDTDWSPELGHEGERFAHYALRDKGFESMIEGTPIQALCGKVWVPSRDPKRYPVCPECKELYEMGPEGRLEHFRNREE